MPKRNGAAALGVEDVASKSSAATPEVTNRRPELRYQLSTGRQVAKRRCGEDKVLLYNGGVHGTGNSESASEDCAASSICWSEALSSARPKLVRPPCELCLE